MQPIFVKPSKYNFVYLTRLLKLDCDHVFKTSTGVCLIIDRTACWMSTEVFLQSKNRTNEVNSFRENVFWRKDVCIIKAS